MLGCLQLLIRSDFFSFIGFTLIKHVEKKYINCTCLHQTNLMRTQFHEHLFLMGCMNPTTA